MPRRDVVRVVLLLLAAAPPARAWEVSLAGTPPDARPFGLAVNVVGNVLTGGRTPGSDGFSDGIVARLAALDGAISWQQLIVGTKTGNDIVRALTVDANGNPVVLGQVANVGTNADALVAKLASGDGQPLWRRDLDGGISGRDDARTAALLAGGDVIAAGSSPTAGSPDTITVWRLDGTTGATLWTQRLTGTDGSAQRLAIAADALYVGAHVPVGNGTHFTVSRLAAADGTVAWSETVLGTGNVGDELTGLAVSGGTQVVLSARLFGGVNPPDFVVVALDAATGEESWRVVVDGSATGVDDADGARALAVDAAGQILAAGLLSNAATQDDLVVLKLRSADGQELWRSTAEGSDPGSEEAGDVAIDSHDDVVAAARLRNLRTNGDLSALKFSGATGALVWQQSFDGTQHVTDTAFNVAVDADGHVAVAGRLRNGDQGDGYAVARLSGVSGASLPCGNGLENAGEECDDGNPVAGDGCRTDCTVERCADGLLDPQDECDDGNTAGGNCCSSTCRVEADGTACDDGDVCFTPDRCANGVCVGEAALACPSSGACEVGYCDSEAGGCVIDVFANGTPCNDGNRCTIGDRCGDAVCIGGLPPSCDDDDPCTTDVCEAAVGCSHPGVGQWDSVLCVFERRTISLECGDPVPEPFAKRLEKTELLLNVAAAEQRRKAACRTLKRAGRSARKSQRFATRWRDEGLLPFACGQAIVDEMIFLRARIQELRTGVC